MANRIRDLPRSTEGLSEDDFLDWHLANNPSFVAAMTHLIEGIESGEIPLEQFRVEQFEQFRLKQDDAPHVDECARCNNEGD